MAKSMDRILQEIEEARDHSIDEFTLEGLDEILKNTNLSLAVRVTNAIEILAKREERRNG
jgi:hypothetical protein